MVVQSYELTGQELLKLIHTSTQRKTISNKYGCIL